MTHPPNQFEEYYRPAHVKSKFANVRNQQIAEDLVLGPRDPHYTVMLQCPPTPL